jgi:uncharacterized membrane protein YebE (DUF533 family)
MLNAEKLLGGMLLGGTRRRTGISSLIPGGAGMLMLGIAMEAFEHFTKNAATPSAGLPPPPPPAPIFPPPQPPGIAPSPVVNSLASPPPELPSGQHSILLIRAMIAAANADNAISQEERGRILDRMQRLDMTPEEKSFINNELLAPARLEDIAGQVRTLEAARQVYAVSLMAIEVDTDAERAYMKNLAGRLGLDSATISEIHQVLGVELLP